MIEIKSTFSFEYDKFMYSIKNYKLGKFVIILTSL